MNKNDLSYGFVVLSPEHNVGRLTPTIVSIRSKYPQAEIICVTGADCPDTDVAHMTKCCPVYKGKNTVTSLINSGAENSTKDWNIFVMEGTIVAPGLVRKLCTFMTSELDILYPIVVEYDRMGIPINLHDDFPSATINGLMFNRIAFNKIGAFSDNPIHISKLLWAVEAINHGCQFKGIMGAKIL